jgi:hypothetical protein
MPETAIRAIAFFLVSLIGAGSGAYVALKGTPVQAAGALYATVLTALILLALNAL